MTAVCADVAKAETAPPESIEQLFEALEAPLLSYALRLLGERTRAEDIVQEAFLKLQANFAATRLPRHWLFRTVHNLALNQRRLASNVVPLPGTSTPEMVEQAGGDLSPDEQIARCEGIEIVRASLAALDERSREVVRLKFHEDLSYKQISEHTGLTVSHVGYILHHALKNMGAELARTGLTP